MIRVTIDLKGIQNFTNQVHKAVEEAVAQEAQDMFQESQQKCPVLTGKLKASGYIKKISTYHYEVGYTAPYALKKDQDYSSKGAGYISSVLQNRQARLIQRIKNTIGR